MDVGNPSNFIRILEIFHNNYPELKDKLSSYSITDGETIATIGEVYQKYHYLLDPHGAVGYLSLSRFLRDNPDQKGLFLETAHPVKFPESVEKVTGKKIPLPLEVAGIMDRQKSSVLMKPGYENLKEFLLRNW
jgi:threonine synthase